MIHYPLKSPADQPSRTSRSGRAARPVARAVLLSLIEQGHRDHEHVWQSCPRCRRAMKHLAAVLGVSVLDLRAALLEFAIA